jgi:hypothetical protein
LRRIVKEFGYLPRQGTEVVGERDADRIAPCGAAGSKIDLSSRSVRDAGDPMGGVESFPIGDPSQNSLSGASSFCCAEDCGRGFICENRIARWGRRCNRVRRAEAVGETVPAVLIGKCERQPQCFASTRNQS